MENERCPKCGSTNISEAQFDVNFKIYPIDILIKAGKGSQVAAMVCTQCGNILSLRATRPEKLK